MSLDFLDNGAVTEPLTEDTARYNYRELIEYCKEIGKEPADLSNKEREKFRTN
jgi:hypothetical protein